MSNVNLKRIALPSNAVPSGDTVVKAQSGATQLQHLTLPRLQQKVKSPKYEKGTNKNPHNFRYHFLVQFFILFHMVASILFGLWALKTLKRKFLIG